MLELRWTKMGKKGEAIGEGIVMIYRLMVISLIAVIIFGVSSVFYNYEIDVRDVEARILAREISECLLSDGVLDLDEISESDYDNIVSYCGILWSDRFYVGTEVRWLGVNNQESMMKLHQGDSGALWVAELFDKAVGAKNSILGEPTDGIEKYNPGYFEFEYPVFILNDKNKIEGNIKMEVLVNHED